MNVKKGIFRAWIVASVCWFIVTTLRIILHCDLYGTALWCNWGYGFWGYGEKLAEEWPSVILTLYFGPPALVYLIGLAAWWTLKGFRQKSN